MRRIVVLFLTSTAGVLAAAAPAASQGISSATPSKAGKASSLHFEVDGLAPPISGRLPSALALTAPSGFRMNLEALSRRCRQEAAKLNECPAGSLMGNGLLVVTVTAPDGVRDVNIPVNVYLHSSRRILAVAFVFGWRVVPGTLNAADGIAIGFDPLPAGPPFPNVSYALKRISFDFAARRVIKERKVKRVNGKRRVVVRKRRVSLITNPRTCKGSWTLSITLRFGDGTVTPLAAPTRCSAA
jgi:hypothetical protein